MYSDYICQKCYKSKDILEALGKLQSVDGYLQCKDCHSDLEYESVVIRDIHLKRNRNDNIPLPKWYRKELKKKGFLRKVDMSKYVTEEDRAVFRKVAKELEGYF